MQRRRFHRAHAARAMAMGAGFGAGFDQAGMQPLARHLQQAEGGDPPDLDARTVVLQRSEEHTSELQSLMRTSYAVFCLKKKNNASTISRTLRQNKTTHN